MTSQGTPPGAGTAQGAVSPAEFVLSPAVMLERLDHVLDWWLLEEPFTLRMRRGEELPPDHHRQLRHFVLAELARERMAAIGSGVGPDLARWCDGQRQQVPVLAQTFTRFIERHGLRPGIEAEFGRQWEWWREVVTLARPLEGGWLAELDERERARRALLLTQTHFAQDGAAPGGLHRPVRSLFAPWGSLADRALIAGWVAAHALWGAWRALAGRDGAVLAQARRRIRRPGLRRWLRDRGIASMRVLVRAMLRQALVSPVTGTPPRRPAQAGLMQLAGRYFLATGAHELAWECLGLARAWGSTRTDLTQQAAIAAHLAGLYLDAELAYRCAIAGGEAQALLLRNLAQVLIAHDPGIDPELELGCDAEGAMSAAATTSTTPAADALSPREREAAALLARAARLSPAVRMSHQNLAAGYDESAFRPTAADLLPRDELLLHGAANLAGERLVHIGEGQRGVRLYGRALHYQQALARGARLPAELRAVLAAGYGVDAGQPVRILSYEWVTLIGHIAMLDSYRKLQLTGMSQPGQPLLLAPRDKVANSTYLSLWRSQVRVVDEPALIDALFPYQRWFGDSFNGCLRADGTPADWTELGARGQIAWDRTGRGPLIQIPDHLRDAGQTALRQMGLADTDWFVAMHIRGEGFHREGRHSMQIHRNASVSDYFGAMRAITARGGWVIRLGDASMPPLPPMERVIDYPHTRFKSAQCDVFLAAAARFFVGTTSGLTNAVISLGTPCLLVNCISNYFQLWNERVLFTLKPLWSERERRHLRLREMVADPVRWKIFNIHRLHALGLTPHANTAAEITAACEEMLERLVAGPVMRRTPADEALAAHCADAGNPHYFGNGRLSRSFFEGQQAGLFAD